MSNRSRPLFVIFIVLVFLFVAVVPTSAQATKTLFTATETFVADLSLGTETFPDGRYNLRDGISLFHFEASDPRLDNAEDLITINWDFKFMPEPVFVSGQMWGKFKITNEGGYWEGTWNGVREENGFSYFHYGGVGGGGYAGMKLKMWGERLDPDPTVPETWQGIIIEPGG
ncbi:MAG: hypothetical protein A2W35_18975 [Chloroflexi bacterium RBG_16_57_11]|nr:MAG: hypothetical protein A2W35_18975 [Chloroflexi bacterium RBG_16_57_11]